MAKSRGDGSASDAGEAPAESYRDAMNEIDDILRAIDGDEALDVDDLANRVERASVLLKFCDDRLKAAEVRVKRVAESLAPPEE